MKKIVILIVFLFSSMLFAQQETLLRDGHIEHGGFGGPVVKFAQVKGEFGLLVGGRGGWLINHSFVLGGGGYGLTNNIKTDININGSTRRVQYGYGGVYLAHFFDPYKIVHVNIGLLIGAGATNISDGDYFDNEGTFDNSDSFFALEPEVSLDLNVTSFFRVGAGISYLYVSGVDRYGLEDSDFSGPSLFLDFKFGKF
ncbi:MAG: hypothetical protein SCALA702_09780 [Melioribacteraceae bacterium]|nr:MAG: hypothetical protein SCALA702_09780 [Melioribacteraceae bacterium]